MTYLYDFPREWLWHEPRAASDTFKKPTIREGFVDARRDDGCIPVITTLKGQEDAMPRMWVTGELPLEIVRRGDR